MILTHIFFRHSSKQNKFILCINFILQLDFSELITKNIQIENQYIYMLFLDVEGKVPEHRITGQYRNKSNLIWDPHPQYLIDAFNLHLHLILYQDNDFIPKHMKVILLKMK